MTQTTSTKRIQNTAEFLVSSKNVNRFDYITKLHNPYQVCHMNARQPHTGVPSPACLEPSLVRHHPVKLKEASLADASVHF